MLQQEEVQAIELIKKRIVTSPSSRVNFMA
jgi:hypothetical protein